MRNCSIGAFFDGLHENPDDFCVRAVRERHRGSRPELGVIFELALPLVVQRLKRVSL